MGAQVHYEVFVRRGQARSWSLIDALESRAGALKLAQENAANGTASVRVVKETYNDATGGYMAVTIFEELNGKPVKETAEADEDGPALPCVSPEDFYTVHGRATLIRLCGDTLARWRVTAYEFLHRPDLVERFEAAGNLYQHAVQKLALAQARPGAGDVPKTMRALFELCERGAKRLYKEDRAGRIPALDTAARVVAYADSCGDAGDGPFRIGLALARYLAAHEDWSAKTLAILAVVEHGTGQTVTLAKAIDAVAAETVSSASAVQALLGPQAGLDQALLAMANLYLGRTAPDATPGYAALARAFAANGLPEARTAVARRVLAEISSPKRLAQSTEEELKALKAITLRLVMGPPVLMPHEDIVTAVTIRSKRYVLHESILAWLDGERDAGRRIERLLALEENVVGGENKRRIWDVIDPILKGQDLEAALTGHKDGPIAGLLRIGDLARRFVAASLPEANKQQALGVLDRLAAKIGASQGFAARTGSGKATDACRALAEGLAAGGLQNLPKIRGQLMTLLLPFALDGSLKALLAASLAARKTPEPEKAAEALLIKAEILRGPVTAAASAA
jgi:hypothetical protein